MFNLVDRIEKVEVNEAEIASYLPSIFRKLEWLSEEDLIKRVVSLEFNRLLDYYRDAEELDIPEERSQKKEKKRGESDEVKKSRGSQPGFARLFINLGKNDGLYPNTLIDMINRNVGGHVLVG